MKIYKFIKNTVELSQYYKNIGSIRSIIIIGNTCGLCGWFDMIEDKKWEEMVPRPNIDKTCDAAYENMDVLESLINNKAEIVVVCDCEDTKTYWETVYHYFCVLMDKEEIRNFKMIDSIKENKDYETVMKDIKTKVEKRKHKFDVGFINAPYDGTLHEKFESMMFDLCNDEIVWVGPTTWLLGKKQSKVLTEPVDKYHVEIQSINGCEYFDAGNFSTMSIVYVDKKANDTATLFDGISYDKCNRITSFSNDAFLVQFNEYISKLCKENLQMHVKYENTKRHELMKKQCTELNPNKNWWCIRIPGACSETALFYAGEEPIVKQYKELSTIVNGNKPYLRYYFPFGTKEDALNFKRYIKSFFVRTCIHLMKNDIDLTTGILLYIPWFDFSDPMFAGSPEDIDVALFRKYGISQQIVDHILEILPNYYNLDLTKYKNI